ncbi:MAG: hypothetical protein JNL87_12960 [Burkholderiaceae bacterium]|nr:hypothetical protein [Burkholderiaceae bacterium]
MAAAPAVAAAGFGTPFAEQLAFFRRKLNLPTEAWDDIMRAAHDRAFIVAGAAKADLLADLREAVDSTMASGGGLNEFRQKFRAVVAKNGWTGWTGDGSAAGEAWRTRVIYQTNMSTSYAAGRWRQLNEPGFAELMPWWRYVHADGQLHPRPLHLAWNGITLPREHAFWKTHFAPNGWGCRCEIRAVAAPAAGDKTAPPEGWDAIDPKTGEPVGIDKGFGYAPGANAAAPLQQLVDQKLIKLDAPIGAAMWQALEPAIAMERRLAWTDLVDRSAQTLRAQGDTVLATAVRPDTVAALAEQEVVLENAAVWLRDHELVHALRDSKVGRGKVLPLAVWRDLPALLARAPAWLDTQDHALLYSIDAGAALGKVVVRVNYNEKGRFGGLRARITSNFIQTGGLIEERNLAGDRYVALR